MSKLSLPKNIMVLGDPHLGRKFKTGVPLHRIGEREALQWAQFREGLLDHKGETHINMGDLFDRFIVPPEVVLMAADIYRSAAKKHPLCDFVVREGNHDVSKDSDRASSFDLFERLVEDSQNIFVVRNEPLVLNGFGFVPYHAFKPTVDLVSALPRGLEAVFGHWDIVDFGGDNVIPTKLMADQGVKLAVSGHDHVARTERFHGVDVIVTGSMQPYTHAEDNNGEWYVTLTLDELEPEAVKDKNVRILLREGETLPADLDCLSLTAKRVTSEEEKLEVDTSDFDSVDMKDLLARTLEGLSCKDRLLSLFEEGRDQ
jgi:predicted phosphodiesterase